MKDLGELHHFMGITVERYSSGMFLHQHQYIVYILERAGMYLVFTRLDIAYAIQQVCLHVHALREPHLIAMKRILRYLWGTTDFNLLRRSRPPTSPFTSMPTGLDVLTRADPPTTSMCSLATVSSPCSGSNNRSSPAPASRQSTALWLTA
eukprot:XP_020397233.1 uncharacterized protein LOC109941141 [Zea mays]